MTATKGIIITGTTSIAPTIRVAHEALETVTTRRRSKFTKHVSRTTEELRTGTERSNNDRRGGHHDEPRNKQGNQNHWIELQDKSNETNPTMTRTPKNDKHKGTSKDQVSAQSASKATGRIPSGKAKDSSQSTKDTTADPKVIELVASTPLTQTFEYIDEAQEMPSIGDVSVAEKSPHTEIEEHESTITPTDQTLTSSTIIATQELIFEETMMVDGTAVETTPVVPEQQPEQSEIEETDNIEIIKEIPKSNMKILTLNDLIGELTPVVSDFEAEPEGRVKSKTRNRTRTQQ